MKHSSIILEKDFHSSFLSCEKDRETIWKKLFIESRPYSDKLIRLLTVNTKDCLDDSQHQYDTQVKKYRSLARLKQDSYIRDVPQLKFPENSEIKSFIILDFNDFVPTSNPEFRNCVVDFNIICHPDYWELGDYRTRPWTIAGYIDGIVNNGKFSGIGELSFLGCSQFTMDESLSGCILRYVATHGSDDYVEDEEDED